MTASATDDMSATYPAVSRCEKYAASVKNNRTAISAWTLGGLAAVPMIVSAYSSEQSIPVVNLFGCIAFEKFLSVMASAVCNITVNQGDVRNRLEKRSPARDAVDENQACRWFLAFCGSIRAFCHEYQLSRWFLAFLGAIPKVSIAAKELSRGAFLGVAAPGLFVYTLINLRATDSLFSEQEAGNKAEFPVSNWQIMGRFFLPCAFSAERSEKKRATSIGAKATNSADETPYVAPASDTQQVLRVAIPIIATIGLAGYCLTSGAAILSVFGKENPKFWLIFATAALPSFVFIRTVIHGCLGVADLLANEMQSLWEKCRKQNEESERLLAERAAPRNKYVIGMIYTGIAILAYLSAAPAIEANKAYYLPFTDERAHAVFARIQDACSILTVLFFNSLDLVSYIPKATIVQTDSPLTNPISDSENNEPEKLTA